MNSSKDRPSFYLEELENHRSGWRRQDSIGRVSCQRMPGAKWFERTKEHDGRRRSVERTLDFAVYVITRTLFNIKSQKNGCYPSPEAGRRDLIHKHPRRARDLGTGRDGFKPMKGIRWIATNSAFTVSFCWRMPGERQNYEIKL